MEETDDVLMSRIAQGDRRAFALLVERHLLPLHAYAMRLTRSRSDADDLAQETFLRVWQGAGTWKPGIVRVSTWLHRITHNACVDAWRRGEDTESFDDDADVPIDAGFDAGEDVSPGEQPALLNKLMNTLPLGQRTALSLSVITGFSTAETAHIMGLTPHAVESLLARARRALRGWQARNPQPGSAGFDAIRRNRTGTP